MNAETIRNLLTRQPFEPFELYLTNSEFRLVRHPEMARVIGARVYVHVPEGNYEVMCSLLHIVSVRPVQAAA